jgi:hypothetical protein
MAVIILAAPVLTCFASLESLHEQSTGDMSSTSSRYNNAVRTVQSEAGNLTAFVFGATRTSAARRGEQDFFCPMSCKVLFISQMAVDR